MARTGQNHPPAHIFVDREGNQVDMAIDASYVILETYFRGYSSSKDWGAQTINGNFYHVVAPRVVLKEEQELLD